MPSNNGDSDHETILCYLGPSLPVAQAMEILPEAIFKPAAKQGDITSDLVNLNPTRVLLIDGVFRENLSPWHKEILYGLQYPGVKGVYGASSMGALRASEMDWLGMIGVGRVYEWYRDGVTEDDAEVAVHFSIHKGNYHLLSVPLCDIRAGVERLPEDQQELGRDFLERMRQVFYMERTPELCRSMWGATDFPFFPQKQADACELLANFRRYESKAEVKPESDHLSLFFQALFERDRRIKINGFEVPQQHIDAHVILHNPEWERICWDAANQELALLLCNCLSVTISMEDIERESVRFQSKAALTTIEEFRRFLNANGWSHHDYDRVMIQNARIRKLQHALTVSKVYRHNTQSILDYLRTHLGFEFWASEAVQLEKRIKESGVDDWMGIDMDKPVLDWLVEHFEKEGLELKCTFEEYLLETGFGNLTELGVALTRIAAGKEQTE